MDLKLPSLQEVSPSREKKKILLLGDDIRMHSGIATMSKEIVLGTVDKYDWVQLGALQKHPEQGKVIDLSEDVQKNTGVSDASVKLYPWSGYGDPKILRTLLRKENPDAIMIFTDPRYWEWLFSIEHEIRQIVPIVYYNIWDDVPYPHWNEKYYNSVDMLLNISKQTQNIVQQVLFKEKKPEGFVRYVPHGINSDIFTLEDVSDPAYVKFSSQIRNSDDDFIILWNNRNIRRKNPGDVLLAFKYFLDHIDDKHRSKCKLVLHSAVRDPNGTDLKAVADALDIEDNVIFSTGKLDSKHMNYLYNLSDVTLNIASNEGFGLSSAESIMSGTVVVNNVTGGLQDQMRFENEKGNWISFTEDFPSNHTGHYKKHGAWAFPVFPSNRSLQGSVITPYIFDDRCRFEDVGEILVYIFSNTTREERKKRGEEGRRWMMSEESGMSSKNMCNRFLESFDHLFENWEKPSKFSFEKVENKIKNKKLGLLYAT